jgi:quercetin dioxygenase-like cupin family protein
MNIGSELALNNTIFLNISLMEKHNIYQYISQSPEDSWMSFNIDRINNNNLRFRFMENIEAKFHTHTDSDECFFVVSGTVYIDTENETYILNMHDLLVIPANTKHRARVDGKALILVIDGIDK